MNKVPGLQRGLRGALLVIAFALGALAYATGLIPELLQHGADIAFLTREHLFLVAISGGLAIAVGVPAGILLSRPAMRDIAETVIQGFNIGQTVPTLAVLAIAMTILGIGVLPAIVALWVYSLLPIVRNTYSGLKAVPRHLLDAARGMGMTPSQMLWRVELPNALYVIIAGIRTAIIINIGTAPLAFLIGAGGLGQLIFTGISLFDTPMMLAGAIPTALLAVIVDFIMEVIVFTCIPRGVNPLRQAQAA